MPRPLAADAQKRKKELQNELEFYAKKAPPAKPAKAAKAKPGASKAKPAKGKPAKAQKPRRK